MTQLLHTIDPPEPGVFGAGTLGTSLLRAALVVTHATNAELAAAVDEQGAGSDNHAEGADEMRWANGLEFQPYTCADAAVIDPCATTNAGMDQTLNRPAARPYVPFVVDAHDACSTYGWQAAQYEARARRMMAARESKAVGAEFWSGTILPKNPHLADDGSVSTFPATVVTAGTGVSPRSGIALLVQALADGNGGAGMVHMRPRLFEYAASVGLFRYEGGKWYTHAGQLVVADAGYAGIGPAGQAVNNTLGAITEWAYATDLIEVHRGPVDVFAPTLTYQSVQHQSNKEVVRAQRFYAPIFNGCVLAAVSITTPATDE